MKEAICPECDFSNPVTTVFTLMVRRIRVCECGHCGMVWIHESILDPKLSGYSGQTEADIRKGKRIKKAEVTR